MNQKLRIKDFAILRKSGEPDTLVRIVNILKPLNEPYRTYLKDKPKSPPFGYVVVVLYGGEETLCTFEELIQIDQTLFNELYDDHYKIPGP